VLLQQQVQCSCNGQRGEDDEQCKLHDSVESFSKP
jgi:hypothetical protein